MRGKLVLLRHGETDENKKRTFYGQKNVPLNKQGEADAKQAGVPLKQNNIKVDKVVSSDLDRAKTTARLALDEAGQSDLSIFETAELRERNPGVMQDLTPEEARAKFGPETVANWLTFSTAPTGGESYGQVEARAMGALQRDAFPEIMEGKTVMVASHDRTIAAIAHNLYGLSEKEALSEFKRPQGVPIVIEFDDNGKARPPVYLYPPGATSESRNGGDFTKTPAAAQPVEVPSKLLLGTVPHLAEKYPVLTGKDRGTFKGEVIMPDGKSVTMEVPRRVDPDQDLPGLLKAFPRAYDVTGIAPGSLDEAGVLKLMETRVPDEMKRAFREVVSAAKTQAEAGMAAPFKAGDEKRLYYVLVYSYVHSADVETLQSAAGYPLKAKGVHDLVEMASADTVKRLAQRPNTPAWLKKYADSLKPGTEVNVGFMNPNILKSVWNWRPDPKVRLPDHEGADVHLASSHHKGDDGSTDTLPDPIEAGVNGPLHLREDESGVRKERVARWADIGRMLEGGIQHVASPTLSAAIAKDTVKIQQEFEKAGIVFPWHLAKEA